MRSTSAQSYEAAKQFAPMQSDKHRFRATARSKHAHANAGAGADAYILCVAELQPRHNLHEEAPRCRLGQALALPHVVQQAAARRELLDDIDLSWQADNVEQVDDCRMICEALEYADLAANALPVVAAFDCCLQIARKAVTRGV